MCVSLIAQLVNARSRTLVRSFPAIEENRRCLRFILKPYRSVSVVLAKHLAGAGPLVPRRIGRGLYTVKVLCPDSSHTFPVQTVQDADRLRNDAALSLFGPSTAGRADARPGNPHGRRIRRCEALPNNSQKRDLSLHHQPDKTACAAVVLRSMNQKKLLPRRNCHQLSGMLLPRL